MSIQFTFLNVNSVICKKREIPISKDDFKILGTGTAEALAIQKGCWL